MTERYRRSPHVVYELKYHFVWVPKYRYCVLQGDTKEWLQRAITQICEDLEILIIEGEICEDHVHMCLSVPPKLSPSEVMKRIKGATSERIFREFPELRRRYWGQHFWARGFFVSSIGIDEETIKKYIQSQRETSDQLKFWK